MAIFETTLLTVGDSEDPDVAVVLVTNDAQTITVDTGFGVETVNRIDRLDINVNRVSGYSVDVEFSREGVIRGETRNVNTVGQININFQGGPNAIYANELAFNIVLNHTAATT